MRLELRGIRPEWMPELWEALGWVRREASEWLHLAFMISFADADAEEMELDFFDFAETAGHDPLCCHALDHPPVVWCSDGVISAELHREWPLRDGAAFDAHDEDLLVLIVTGPAERLQRVEELYLRLAI